MFQKEPAAESSQSTYSVRVAHIHPGRNLNIFEPLTSLPVRELMSFTLYKLDI